MNGSIMSAVAWLLACGFAVACVGLLVWALILRAERNDAIALFRRRIAGPGISGECKSPPTNESGAEVQS